MTNLTHANCFLCCKEIFDTLPLTSSTPVNSDNLTDFNYKHYVTCHRFFILSSRYLNISVDHFNPSKTLDTTNAHKTGNYEGKKVCHECFKRIDSFCDMYELLEHLKLEINQSLETIAGILQKNVSNAGSKKTIRDDEMQDFKDVFIRQVGRKREETFPRLTLKLEAQPLSPLEASVCSDKTYHAGHQKPITSSIGHPEQHLVSSPTLGTLGQNEPLLEVSQVQKENRTTEKNFQYKCSFCEKHFVKKCYLIRHANNWHLPLNLKDNETVGEIQQAFSQTTEASFKCKFCSKIFTTGPGRDGHERKHVGDTPYKCRVCHMRFCYTSSRSYHERKIHNIILKRKDGKLSLTRTKKKAAKTSKVDNTNKGEKSFKCAVALCSYTCDQTQQLIQHQYSHSYQGAAMNLEMQTLVAAKSEEETFTLTPEFSLVQSLLYPGLGDQEKIAQMVSEPFIDGSSRYSKTF